MLICQSLQARPVYLTAQIAGDEMPDRSALSTGHTLISRHCFIMILSEVQPDL